MVGGRRSGGREAEWWREGERWEGGGVVEGGEVVEGVGAVGGRGSGGREGEWEVGEVMRGGEVGITLASNVQCCTEYTVL